MTVPPATTEFTGGQAIAAGSSAVYTAQIVDQNGVGIPAASLNTLTLSLYDKATDAVINSIKDIGILNTGRGQVDASGNLTVTFQPQDMAATGAPLPGAVQYRSMVLQWSYNGGNAAGRHQVNFAIVVLAEA